MLESFELANVESHSIRKGAITFASNGTPDASPWDSFQVRTRWKTGAPYGSMHGRYVKFECAGDQLAGRILSGLYQDTREFATNDPHFIINPDNATAIAIKN